MAPYIGIDLGTTNSCVAVFKGGQPVVIPNALGKRLTPSAVRLFEDGTAQVGEYALRARSADPANTIYSIKRFIGRRYNEVADFAPLMPFEVTIGQSNLAVIRSHGQLHTPQFISAHVLRALREDAERYLGEPVGGAVICVPAYFSALQREATRQAAAIAGLEVMRIIIEPTAAALAYGAFRKRNETIAVLDLGGGTFDVALLEVGEGVVEVRAVSGDNFLGGDDFDAQLAEWFAAECYIQHRQAPAASQFERLREAAVETKEILSQSLSAQVRIPYLMLDGGATVDFQTTLTRELFEDICAELFGRLKEPCDLARKDAWVTDSLSRVLLVGGATRMPGVEKMAAQVFGPIGVRAVNPDEAIALGAAVMGGILGGEVRDALLLDVTSATLGVEDHRGTAVPVIARNTTIPTKKSEIFSTAGDDQSSVEIRVVEGEYKLAGDNRTVARLVLDELPFRRSGTLQIEVTFDIDANQSLNVSARDRASGRESKVSVRAQTGLTDDDISRLAMSLLPPRIF